MANETETNIEQEEQYRKQEYSIEEFNALLKKERILGILIGAIVLGALIGVYKIIK